MFTTISTVVSLKNRMQLPEPVVAINATTTTPYIGSNLYNYFIFNQSGSITFTNPVDVSLQILCIAGGGGGGSGSPGGGGAGGMLQNTTVLNETDTLNIVVGNGGTSNVAGSNSSVLGNSLAVTAFGGGYGGLNSPGGPGGSGGGGGSNSISAQRLGGAGTSGQGNNGGNGFYAASNNKSGGGGGGAGGPGGNGTTGGASGNGAGGVGKKPLLTGLPSTLLNTVYATGGKVGSGPGASNTGNGGGSANSGGSGIVIILYKSNS